MIGEQRISMEDLLFLITIQMINWSQRVEGNDAEIDYFNEFYNWENECPMD